MIAEKIPPGLYFVATPIGAARDITLRALDVLAGCDMIAAEDTRNTRKLMDIHGIALGGRPLIAYHDHNAPKMRPRILAALADGQSVAYVSDAGTPLVADPGFSLSRAAIAENLPVFAVPGASAVLAALTVAGLPTNRFLFAGFPPNKSAARRKFLDEVKSVPATLIFYESGKRIQSSLKDMAHSFGDGRAVAVCRELTKRYEEVLRGTLEEVIANFESGAVTKGEFVVVLGPPAEEATTDREIEDALKQELQDHSTKEAVRLVTDRFDLPRKRVYDLALALKGKL
jgi:16S rRNA (cytidine1402-2'-O)-methyltransferase